MLKISPISAFDDNYIWLLQQGKHAVVIDPGDANSVLERLRALSLDLVAILVTHHHADHIDGINELLRHYPASVYAPVNKAYNFPHQPVAENSKVRLQQLNLELTVMELPGHTLDHVAYYGADCLFCGDTLFGGGCGRLFEGTPAQMFHSLQRLAALPENTAVYSAHEYTQRNLEFAITLEPDNPALIRRLVETMKLRQANHPTLPSSIKLERETNPFLRCEIPTIQKTAGFQSISAENNNPVDIFTTLRTLRNHF